MNSKQSLPIQSILNKFPPASDNNSRQIIKGKLDRFSHNPSESKAQELDRLGITTDYSAHDAGNGERGSNF